MTSAWQRLRYSHPAFRFALVGGSGFIVDVTVFLLLFEVMKIDLLAARSLAFILAATSNWWLNRAFTFVGTHTSGSKSRQWLRFIISSSLSAVPNLGVFWLLVRLLPESLASILLAMIAGILVGYWCNYQLAKSWVFNPARSATAALGPDRHQ